MGYEVRIKHSTATLPKENENAALQIWLDLNKPENDHLKRGGSWRDGKKTGSWYSWLGSNYHEHIKTADGMLKELGFETVIDPDGNLGICEYESKRGQEQLFFERAAHLMTGEILWEGENGETWVWHLGKEGEV